MDILVVDDHLLVREGLCRIIESENDLRVCGQAATGAEAFELFRAGHFDLVVLDISLPDRSGIETLKDLLSCDPSARVLMLSIHPESEYALRAIRSGAAGYLTKDSVYTELIRAIRLIAAGHTYLPSETGDRMSELLKGDYRAKPHELLSDREFEVLLLLASGKTVTESARHLNLSPKTVSTYRSRILEKMNMRTNAELTHYAYQYDLIDD